MRKRRRVIERGPLFNRINWGAFFNSQAMMPSFDNRFSKKENSNKKVKRLFKGKVR